MTTVTTCIDVFGTAIGMERIGKDFYEALALASDSHEVREFCLRTARDEATHLATFQRMRQEWARRDKNATSASANGQAMERMAKEHIQPDPRAVQKVALGGNLKDALEMAIGMEQDAINFYAGIVLLAPTLAAEIQAIVDEERKHLATLRWLAN